MNRVGKSLIVLLVAVAGIWGCSQSTTGQAAAQADREKIKVLEAKCSKWEDDCKSATVARDQARKQITTMEEQRAQMEEHEAQMQKDIDAGKLVAKERDELRQQVDARTGERDTLQMRCAKLKEGLKTLLGQDDALSIPVHPAAPITTGAGGGM